MKETFLDCHHRVMFNKQLMQYQIFIKNPPAESAFQETYLSFHVRLKVKVVLKIMKLLLRAVTQKQPFTK